MLPSPVGLIRNPANTNSPRNAPTAGTHRHRASPTNSAPTSKITIPGGGYTGNRIPAAHRNEIPRAPTTSPKTVIARGIDRVLRPFIPSLPSVGLRSSRELATVDGD